MRLMRRLALRHARCYLRLVQSPIEHIVLRLHQAPADGILFSAFVLRAFVLLFVLISPFMSLDAKNAIKIPRYGTACALGVMVMAN